MPTLELERRLWDQGYGLVAGIDEVGRGPLAGPVVAGAVILSPKLRDSAPWLQYVDDSKKLTSRQRERAAAFIGENALAVGIGAVGPADIDTLGIGEATKRAMLRAVENLSIDPQWLLTDFVRLEQSYLPFHAVPGGDGRCYSIAAASIVAKVYRDGLLKEAEVLYPGYGFSRHKGYPTEEHRRLLALLGPCPIHRRSFGPVRRVCQGASPAPVKGH